MKMVILAAGLGSRMRESVGRRSKLFADLGGETILDRLRMRGRAGVGELVLRSSAPVVPVGIHYPAAARLGRSSSAGGP